MSAAGECYVTLAPALRETLTAVGLLMADARDPWWVIASAAAALHGAAPITVKDVEVLLSIDDALHLLPKVGVQPRPGSGNEQFRSAVFETWSANPLEVEFMADFQYRHGDAWLAVEPATRLAIDLDGANLFVPDRAELMGMFRSFGRPKDLERARLLAALS